MVTSIQRAKIRRQKEIMQRAVQSKRAAERRRKIASKALKRLQQRRKR